MAFLAALLRRVLGERGGRGWGGRVVCEVGGDGRGWPQKGTFHHSGVSYQSKFAEVETPVIFDLNQFGFPELAEVSNH